MKMVKIEFPKQLNELLEGSELQGPIRTLADRVGEILADNKLPFFPDYTDHGVDHVNCVLRTEVELVPKEVWKQSKPGSDPCLLCDADAAVIIGATLLHDLAMHLRPDGFRELVSKDSRFQAVPWFAKSHEGHEGDRPWRELWEDYEREARRFSDRQLGEIIGEQSARDWKFDGLPDDRGRWTVNHYLVVGEFIRRHHARFAHEIAIYGFPGLDAGWDQAKFPALEKGEKTALAPLADLVGLAARSHGTSLRVCKAYLEVGGRYPRTPKPMGTAVLYPMALLRVADYLQIDKKRAPAVLLQLRNPQSPISVREWEKHLAVQQIGPADDPRGKTVTVSPDVSLPLYLQLRELVSSLQAEMDHSTAVLDEVYGTRIDLGLNQLGLATRRVHSNLQTPAFRDSLPYVPEQTGFSADPNLLTLLVEPLYGKEPSVGVRELIQNAADAVRELHVWCANRGIPVDSLDLPEQDCDVLVDFIKRENGSWFLRVTDRGIGMTSDTIQDYFLRAGACFRRSAEWSKEFVDEEGRPRVVRAGRFGIGAFAVFLLGPAFKLWTRHAGANRTTGYELVASEESQLIEINHKCGLPVGTTIEVEVSADSAKVLELDAERYASYRVNGRGTDWFCWDWPTVTRRIARGPEAEELHPSHVLPAGKDRLPPEWSVLHPEGFEAVFWTFGKQPVLSCNGLKVAEPNGAWLSESGFSWPKSTRVEAPCIAVVDPAANLPLTTQRYGLSHKTVPFIEDLVRDVLLSVIAHALVCGPRSQSEVLTARRRHPLQRRAFAVVPSRIGRVLTDLSNDNVPRWCATAEQMVPADPWLYSLLGADSCLVCGKLGRGQGQLKSDMSVVTAAFGGREEQNGASLAWLGLWDAHRGSEVDFRDWPRRILGMTAQEGMACLGSMITTRLLASASGSVEFQPGDEESSGRWDLCEWRFVRNVGDAMWIEAGTGEGRRGIDLGRTLKRMEAAEDREEERVLFAAEIRTEPPPGPESPIARLWHECLGSRPIPFNRRARRALIVDGCKHPELKRHIEAWQEMKRTRSKWMGRSEDEWRSGSGLLD